MIGIALCPSAPPVKRRRPVYWLEATAIIALGVSWLSEGGRSSATSEDASPTG